jgi:hypothetical protein
MQDVCNVIALSLKIGALMPPFEAAILKEIVINHKEHEALVELHDNSATETDYRETLSELVVQRIADSTYNLWLRFFEDLSTDVGKTIAQQARERRAQNISKEVRPSTSKLHLLTSSLTYGECDFFSLATILGESLNEKCGFEYQQLCAHAHWLELSNMMRYCLCL